MWSVECGVWSVKCEMIIRRGFSQGVLRNGQKTLDTLHTIISCKNFHHPQTKQCEIWNVEFIPQNPSSDGCQAVQF